MKNFLLVILLISSSALAEFKHKSDKNFDLFWKNYILNPSKQVVPAGQKYGPFKPEVLEEIKASPALSRYFAVGMARVYLNSNISKHYPKFEKKFGKLDDTKEIKIWGLIVESVYAEKDDVIEKMRDDEEFRNKMYESKISKVLSLKSL